MAEIIITKDNFNDEVKNSQIPVLVDFWAPWCGPCKMLGPVVAKISEEYDGKIKVCKINVDEEENLARQYMVMSIPTLIAFNNGEIIKKTIGYMEMDDILDMFGDLVK